ncbi:MAG: glycosyltransferase, partial [Pygmaiobacter sp.]
MKATVVIPNLNGAGWLAGSLDSIFAQTMQDFELIVVDDGSTDGSALLLQQALGAHLQLVSQSNAGPGAARNAGARAGAG